MELNAYFTLFLAILFGVIGQMMLKTGMARQPGFKLKELLTLVGNFQVLTGFASYAISILIYFKALENLDLSLAYPTVSLGYVLVVLLSRLYFKEEVSLGRWVAVLLICTGVVLVGLGAG